MLRVSFKILFLSTLFFITACVVETLDDINSIAESEEVISFRKGESNSCRLLIKGKVIDASSLKGLSDASIKMLGGSIGSDENGNYELLYDDAKDYLSGKQFIKITRNGYVYSTFEFNVEKFIDEADCENSTIEVDLDIVMTPVRDYIVISPDGGNYTFTDKSQSIVNKGGVRTVTNKTGELTLVVPPGAVRQDTKLYLTTLNYDQYLGSFDQIHEDYGVIPVPLKRFSFSSANIEFEKPVKLIFDPEIPLDNNQHNFLNYYSLDGNNEWVKESAYKVTALPSGKVQVRTYNLSNVGYVGNNTNGLELHETLIRNLSYQTIYQKKYDNCGCGDGFVYKNVVQNSLTTQISIQADLAKQLLVLRTTKTSLNVAQKQLIEVSVSNQSNSGFILLEEIFQNIVVEGLVEKCDIEEVTLTEVKESFSLKIFGIEISYIKDLFVEMDINNNSCPSSTACHQGCPG